MYELTDDPGLTEETLMITGKNTGSLPVDVVAHKITVDTLRNSILGQQGAEARCSSAFTVAPATLADIPFNTVHYDLEGTEYNISNLGFEPKKHGIFQVIVTLWMTGTWRAGDEIYLMIIPENSRTTIVNTTHHRVQILINDPIAIQCSGLVRVTSVSGITIRGVIYANFNVGTSRAFAHQMSVGALTSYTNIQIKQRM